MPTLAIELNDAAIAVAHPEGVLAVEPGCAAVSEEGIAFGSEALAVARLKPRQAWDRYWEDLGLDPLPRPLPGVKSPADIAHAQLRGLWTRFGAGADEVLLVVPGSFDRAQLALLLGIAQACGMPVCGLVDAAVAASEVAHPGWDVLHLEAQLHSVGLTRLAGESDVEVESFQRVADFGLSSLREEWARRIGAAFVAQTRFDPFTNGTTEQVFFDALPGWLEAMTASPVAQLGLEVSGVTRSISLARESPVMDACERLAGAVRAALRPGRRTALLLGAELAGMPGAIDALAPLPGVRLVPLERASGAAGALARAQLIRAEPDAIRLVTRLARRRAAVELPPLEPEEGGGVGPTHALLGGYAHPIGAAGLSLRVDARGGIAIDDGGDAEPGGFRLVRRDGSLHVECAAGEGVLVNGRPVDGAALEPGDRVGVRDGDAEVQVIALVRSRGA
ncbi:MAG: hypothetical protein QNK04_32820 [Myxococcota bacterium]|nr:hypothetical protein [Myxococcota bacterium]